MALVHFLPRKWRRIDLVTSLRLFRVIQWCGVASSLGEICHARLQLTSICHFQRRQDNKDQRTSSRSSRKARIMVLLKITWAARVSVARRTVDIVLVLAKGNEDKMAPDKPLLAQRDEAMKLVDATWPQQNTKGVRGGFRGATQRDSTGQGRDRG